MTNQISGAWGVVTAKQEKITYLLDNAEPEAFGCALLEWLYDSDADQLARHADRLVLVDEDDYITEPHRERILDYLHAHGGETTAAYDAHTYMGLLASLASTPQAVLRTRLALDASWFPLDSINCKFVYLLNLVDGTLELHAGDQVLPHNEGRFAERYSALAAERSRPSWPVKLAGVWALDNLPTLDELLDAVDDAHALPTDARVALAA